MDESQNQDEGRWGTIFMGPTTDRESTIDKLTERQQNELWTRRTEIEYMERVRAKATLRAQTMLNKARENGEVIRESARQWSLKIKAECDARIAEVETIKQEAFRIRAEAETIRESAHDEGYQIGVEQAMMELDEHRAMLDDATASVLQTIGEQSRTLFETWREELVGLVQDAVTTATGWIITQEQQGILEKLLTDSLQQLESRRRLIIRVNAADRDAVDGIIRSAQERYPDLQGWDVIDDETVDPGGLVLESDSGMIDQRASNRREAMQAILQHLTLPAGEAEIQAEQAVADVLQRTGMTELAAQADARAAQEMAALEPAQPEAIEEEAHEALPEGLEADAPDEAFDDPGEPQAALETYAPPVQSEAHTVAAQAEVASLMQSIQSEDFDEDALDTLDGPPDLSVLTRSLPQGAPVSEERADMPEEASANLAEPAAENPVDEEDIPILEVTVDDADPTLLEQVPNAELPPDMNEAVGTNHIQTAQA